MVRSVDYDNVVAAFFRPSPPGVVPAPVLDASPARRLRDAIEPLAMHSVWSRATNERLNAFGLDFLQRYVAPRAALLGDPDPGVVVAAFGVFSPDLLVPTYEAARAACDRDELLAARDESTAASLRAVLGDVDVAPVADRLVAALSGCAAAGRPLFAGGVRLALPDDPFGRLWRACELAREHRGDSHVAACIADGWGPIAMNVLTEVWVGMPLGSYSATRGWRAEQIAETTAALRAAGLLDGDLLSDAGRARRDALEATTDAMEQPIIDALGADAGAVTAQLDEWSNLCVAAGAFPPDAFKRAAG